MGYSLGWLAVRGSASDSLLRVLGMRGTGTREELPEAEMVGAALPAGWYVVIVQGGEHLLDDKLMQQVSLDCEAVACFLEEHVMYCAATAWSSGHQLWWVGHDSDKGITHLQVKGTPPASFPDIRADLEAKQRTAGGADAGVDYICDIPLEVAKAVTGFRHDQDVEGTDGAPFEVLVATRSAASATPWWKRLLQH
jgi:hypothetical protein